MRSCGWDHMLLVLNGYYVILIKLFLSLSLKTVFHQKPLPIAISAVAV